MPVIIRFDNSVINYDQAFDESDLILMNRTDLNPIGTTGPRAYKRPALELSNIDYSNTHCRFYREQNWAPHLLSPAPLMKVVKCIIFKIISN